MRRELTMALAGAAIFAATPASGKPTTAQSCTAFTFEVGTTAVSDTCAGGFQTNLLKGSPLTGAGLTDLQTLGYTGTGTFLDKIDLTGATIDFGQELTGPTIIGIHYGGAGAGVEATSFFLFDFLTPANSITVRGRTDTDSPFGLSNAVLFSTGGPVPEPTTWAMMIVGFLGMGLAVRRNRRRSEALMQVA